MAVNKDKIWVANLALRKLGSARISSFDENTPESRVIRDVYDSILEEVLCQGQWTFAQKRAALTQTTDTVPVTTDGVSIVYAMPNDCLKVNYYSPSSAIVKLEYFQSRVVILSNVSDLKIFYTFRNIDPNTYFPNFITALATRLASEIGFNLTQATKKAALLLEEYTKIRLPNALSTDAQQGTGQEAIQDEWENARLSGLYNTPRPGDQTWHPL